MKSIILAKSASKYLAKLDKKTIERITSALRDLQCEPMQGDLETIKGERDKMRLRIGNYRVLFRVDNGIIYVLDIGPRGDIYK